MKRIIDHYFKKWKSNPYRKPLILRGVRQVGKTYSAREFGKSFENLVEVNFELYPAIKEIFFFDLDPVRIMKDLEVYLKTEIIPGKTLLFFDEIQESAEALKSLRYFYEIIPDLHVIAAGSLLEFQLQLIGLPVGRVSSLYLYPLSFAEFLAGSGDGQFLSVILDCVKRKKINDAFHKKIYKVLGNYLLTGGMPEVVKTWINTKDFQLCSSIHKAILDTYTQDFLKYAKKYQVKYLTLLFNAIPKYQGQKFKYNNVSAQYKKREIQPALDLLVNAGIVHKIYHSAGNGLPLGAEVNFERFKALFIDIALSQTLLGFDAATWILNPGNVLVNQGAFAEVFIGQELLAYSDCEIKSSLYYWHREARSSNAEVDYLMVKNAKVIPIEVKSGKTGSLKSMHYFLKEHRDTPYGIRFSNTHPEEYDAIQSFPHYALCALVDHGEEMLGCLV